MPQRILQVLGLLAAILLIIGAVSAITGGPNDKPLGDPDAANHDPDGSSPAVDENMPLAEYAELCLQLIGEIPPMNSRDGVVIPITVNGEIPEKYEPCMDCDRPALLPNLGCDGQCVPYSRVQLLRDDHEAQMVALFRRKIIREEDDPLFDEIDLIVHSVITGDTGWFQATKHNPDCDPQIGLNGNEVPLPHQPGAETFWNPPSQVVKAKCGECHDNDPFYYSPYIAQVINEVPANPFGKYSNAIGPFKAWPALKSISTRGNTCTGCHRIGSHYTSGDGLLSATGKLNTPQADAFSKDYPQSHWMPAHNFLTQREWDVVYDESATQLHNWHLNFHDNTDFSVTPIPGGTPQDDADR